MRTRRQERLRRLLAEIGFAPPAEQGWRERAACLGFDPEIFYPVAHQHGATAARSICAECPVRELCLADVMASEDPALRWGVVGGLMPAERSRLFEAQRRAVGRPRRGGAGVPVGVSVRRGLRRHPLRGVPGMTTNPNSPTNSGRLRACRDRCEVCNTVIEHRPDPKRRRCTDHLDQFVLLPTALVRKTTNRTTSTQEGTR